MFRSVLVANRGEIAVRIIKTLRKMGVRSVVVASLPDRHSLAVRSADAHVLLPASSATETYLDIEAVIAAARDTGCEAIHPGYGFLSERSDFAERCHAEGIVFIGPNASILAAMGDKGAARRLALENGVPVVPGWDGDDDEDTLLREGARIGAPLMVKAKGGGGGRGMREVFELSALPEALASARREAASAFGDSRLLLEKLVTGAHHVEVQVVADQHGHFIHLGERDCSVQRRHQKLIEETPSPVVNAELRAELTAAALKLARAIGYVNAGTFEFLVSEADASAHRSFYFLEVNPRLQVEHPVTEEVTGIDLVEWQLRIAAGEPLPLGQADVEFRGHAIEFRINAEDPWDGFRPSSGRLKPTFLDADRQDAGFGAGDSIPPQYDSLIAKLIFRGDDRSASLASARDCLMRGESLGIRSNLNLHAAILRDERFIAGEASVDWLESHLDDILAAGSAPPAWWAAAAAALLPPPITGVRGPASFDALGWIGAESPGCWLDDGAVRKWVSVSAGLPGASHAIIDGTDVPFTLAGEELIRAGSPGEAFHVTRYGNDVAVSAIEARSGSWDFRLVPPPPLPRRAATVTSGATAITAPLSGTIAAVRVSEGDVVEAGALLVLLEAMKMEHRIIAPAAGTVKVVSVHERDVVADGDVLVEIG